MDIRLGKRSLAAVGVFVLLGGLSTVAASASRARSELSGTLTMNVFTFTTPVMAPVIAAFEKLNPGVHIRPRTL